MHCREEEDKTVEGVVPMPRKVHRSRDPMAKCLPCTVSEVPPKGGAVDGVTCACYKGQEMNWATQVLQRAGDELGPSGV